MHHRRHALQALIVATCCCLVSIVLSAYAPQQHEHPATPGAHGHPEAATITNPVHADATSLAAGKQVYDKQCSSCHGERGKGDGQMGEELNPKPADMSDADWKHGSTDGEIFTVVRDGVKNTGMRAYGRKLTTHQLWDVVNYVRSLGPHTH